MSPELAAALQLILNQLCVIASLLKKCCEAPACSPAPWGGPTPMMTAFTLSTAPQKILGINPKRLSFTVSNPAATSSVGISPLSQPATNPLALAYIAAASTQVFNGGTFPTMIQGEWYAWSATGAPQIVVTEEFLT